MYSHDRRDETATPLCGAHRPNKSNPLLTKTQLGTVKATTYDLPPDFQHSYGLAQVRDGLTAGMVVDNWLAHDGTKDVAPARDFKALNKGAVMAGHVDCKGMQDYRGTHDFRVKLGSEKKKSSLPIDENTSFGRPTRPSTPFGDLMSHGFRYDWVMQTESADSVMQARKLKKPPATKASIGHAKGSAARRVEEVQDAPWKMKKFASVAPKVGAQG
jgi:hypothetical protein|eukprot:Transcript_30286.p2 GENE.Transcript_30286~~Transcript_30286.p2  ORF type:complete len:244 (-),score=70.04 Transcript_30286:209-853(-)